MDTGTIVAQHMAGGCLLNLIDCQDNQARLVLYMCPNIHTAIYVSSYSCICFLVLLYMAGGCLRNLINCQDNQARLVEALRLLYICVSSYCCMCVLILSLMCAQARLAEAHNVHDI